MPLFSVCIPVFNGLKYLSQCLDSVLKQSFSDFEVIVLDDCSTDGSFGLLQEYAKTDKRIKLFKNKENIGLVDNWNKCISLASGKWIKFLFQDDFWTPNCLEIIYFKSQLGYSFIFHGRNFLIDNNVKPFIKEFYESEKVNEYNGLKGINEIPFEKINQLVSQSLCFNFFGEPSNVTFKKDLVNEVGFFDSRLVQLCDYEYWVRLTSSYGAYYIPEKLSTFRVHGQATSTQNSISKNFRFNYLDKLIILWRFLNDCFYENLRKNDNVTNLILDEYKKLELEITKEVFRLPKTERKNSLHLIKNYASFAYFDIAFANRFKLYMAQILNQFRNN
jgi:glycosyltransferase involved in cell wall biosynthesis